MLFCIDALAVLILAAEISCERSVLIDFLGEEEDDDDLNGILSGEEGLLPIEVRKGAPAFLLGL